MYFYLIQIFILPLIAIIESKFDAIFMILWTHLSNYISSSNILKIVSNLHLFEGIPRGDRPIQLLRSSRIVGGKDAFYGEARHWSKSPDFLVFGSIRNVAQF
jgi:hypothetical protein